jgi:hypothetical protein
MKRELRRGWGRQAQAAAGLLLALGLLGATGCHWMHTAVVGPPFDRPFPLGQVTDSFWETQQTNAEAADFIFFDHDFVGDSPNLTPGAKNKLQQVALRLEHVPFPVVIEQTPYNRRPELDAQRRRVVVEQLARLGAETAEERVVIAGAFAEGFTAMEGERAYYNALFGNFANFGGIGRRFGGNGGVFR